MKDFSFTQQCCGGSKTQILSEPLRGSFSRQNCARQIYPEKALVPFRKYAVDENVTESPERRGGCHYSVGMAIERGHGSESSNMQAAIQHHHRNVHAHQQIVEIVGQHR